MSNFPKILRMLNQTAGSNRTLRLLDLFSLILMWRSGSGQRYARLSEPNTRGPSRVEIDRTGKGVAGSSGIATTAFAVAKPA